MQELPSRINELAIPAAALPIILALLSSVFPVVVVWLRRLLRSKAAEDDPKEVTRIYEALKQLERQRAISRWFGIMNGLLVFSQFVVGGLLASSFIQEKLSPNQIGTLGVLVLLASLISKHYRPELVARGAARRVVVLKQLVRKASNDLYVLKAAPTTSKMTLIKIQDEVTKGLNAIDDSEFDERQGETVLLPQPSAPTKDGV